MPINKAKPVAKPVVDSEDESEDEDYGSDLESNSSHLSSDWEPMAPDELCLLAADLRSKIEELGRESGRKHDINLTDEQVTMLQKRVAEFRAADKAGRSNIIQDSADRIEGSWGQDTNFDREVVETVPTSPQEIPLSQQTMDLPRHSGSNGYLGYYNKVVKLVDEGLDEETRVKYRTEARKWAEQEAPPEQQQRMFAKHGIDTMQDFSELMYRQYGVRVAILGGYCDNDGPSIMLCIQKTIYLQSNNLSNSYDNNNELGGTSFKARYKGWLHDPMVEEFSRWTAESFGDLANSGEECIIKKDQTPKVKPLIDKHGYPVLPNWETIDRGGLTYKKMVIGQFMSEMYGIAAGGGKRRVPWAKLREAQGDWIAAEYLPEGVTLTQYHHIRLDDANSLLKHWIQRQAAGEIPFRFKKLDKVDRHHGGKRGSETTDGVGGPSSSNNSSLVVTPYAWLSSSRGYSRGSNATSANGQQPRGELPMLEDEGILPPHPPNSPPPPSRTHPLPRIITQGHPHAGSSRAGPSQEHPPNNQAAADIPPSKRQKIDRRLGNAQHVSRRSARKMWPTERAKQTQ
ncbi:hypothetical protein EDB85DRAFT_2147569 [Lactarius pseudohatsudake]|nr:hypothetical protein EDB85DRAFT_2147569 [Lactarius pseudohatsudake]